MGGKRGHKLLDHTADMGLIGWGETIEEAFEEAAAAMFEIVASSDIKEIGGIVKAIKIDLACRDCRDVDLLIEFLNELITRSDIEEIVLKEVKVVSISRDTEGLKIEATAYGVPTEKASRYLITEVKAATYYGAKVERKENGLWYARCVVDI